jgi:hypothetical protein
VKWSGTLAELHVVSALIERRSEVSGQIAELERQITRHQADLVHIDAVLRMYGKDDPEAIRAKDVSRRSDWFRTGECRNLIYDVLRDAEAPVLTRTIAERVMFAKGIDQSDARVVGQIKRSVLGALKRMDGLERVPMDGGMGWEVKTA